MSLSKKHYKKIAELIGEHTVSIENKMCNFISYGFVLKLAQYFKEDNPRFNLQTFFEAIGKESINADWNSINKSMIKINLDTIKENKVLKSKVKTYEQDIINKPLNDMPTNINGRPFKGRL